MVRGGRLWILVINSLISDVLPRAARVYLLLLYKLRSVFDFVVVTCFWQESTQKAFIQWRAEAEEEDVDLIPLHTAKAEQGGVDLELVLMRLSLISEKTDQGLSGRAGLSVYLLL